MRSVASSMVTSSKARPSTVTRRCIERPFLQDEGYATERRGRTLEPRTRLHSRVPLRVLHLTTEFPWPATSGGSVRTVTQLKLLTSLPEVESVTTLSVTAKPV